MSKAIRSYPEHKRGEVVERRLQQKATKGLGYLSALDYQANKSKKTKKGKTPNVRA